MQTALQKKPSIPMVIQSQMPSRKRARSLSFQDDQEDFKNSIKKRNLTMDTATSMFHAQYNHPQQVSTSYQTQHQHPSNSNHYLQINSVLRECHFLRLQRQQSSI